MIEYALEPELSVADFQCILISSMLGERRPIDDFGRLEKMLRHADIIVTAREDGKPIGVARAVTDYSYCCYLSDLAVDRAYQKNGIGKKLIALTQEAASIETSLFLVSAPAAIDYYPKIGMQSFPCFGVKAAR